MFLGHLQHSDPLYGYLKYQIQPLVHWIPHCEYRVFRMTGSNAVYLYEEVHTLDRFIGKFFLSPSQPDRMTAERRLNREYDALDAMRALGFDRGYHYIARPLGRNAALNALLVEECVYGELFSGLLLRSFRNHDSALLYGKLTALAWFLAHFHNYSADLSTRVNFASVCDYAGTLLEALKRYHVMDWAEGEYFYHLIDRWKTRDFMWGDCTVTVHGDATPDNFMFGDGLHVITYDLERLRRTDRVFDVGRLAGELAHFFLAYAGNRYLAEPYIGHFLWEYACHFPDRNAAFQAICRRIPFYMGINFLRIARNNWLNWDYRKRLIQEAKPCLEN